MSAHLAPRGLNRASTIQAKAESAAVDFARRGMTEQSLKAAEIALLSTVHPHMAEYYAHRLAMIEPIIIKPITAQIDYAALDRIDAHVARARAEMGEQRWNELQREWDA